MNDLQRKEFELLKCFTEICDILSIKYYLVCGSALGAVKYKGFIPWDDDVDVAMLRPDYERFLTEAPQYLPEEYFLQTYSSDAEYPNIFAKLRNSDTTYIEKSASKLNINHGIYIDIFPLDGYPEDLKSGRKLERKKRIYKRLLSLVFLPDKGWKKLIVYPMRFVLLRKRAAKLVRKYEKLIAACSVESSQMLANHGNWQGKKDYSPKNWFGEGVYTEFEGLQVRIPSDFYSYLRRKYGEYMQDIPESEKTGHHYYTVCDCTKSYIHYTTGKKQ